MAPVLGLGQIDQEGMTRTATQGLVLVGGFIALLVVTSVAVIKLDREGVRGTVIGAGLGLVNLAVGALVMRRVLRRGMKSAVMAASIS